MNHRRTGKVARLPEELRTQVNEFLDDGVDYLHIIGHLNNHGFPGFSPKNLSNWKDGGYQDWLNHRQRMEEVDIKTAYAVELAREADSGKFQQAAVNLSTLQFYELLNQFDPHNLVRAMNEHPERFPSVINSFAKLTREIVGLERFRLFQQDHAKQDAERNPANLGGISDPTILKMLAALRLHYAARSQPAAASNIPASPDAGGNCSQL